MERPPAPPKKEKEAPPELEELKRLAARLKLAEERYADLRGMIRVVQEDMIRAQKRLTDELRLLVGDINELKRALAALRDNIMNIVEEIKLRARREDLELLKKYIDLWSVVKFATVEQVERMIEEKIK